MVVLVPSSWCGRPSAPGRWPRLPAHPMMSTVS